MQEHIDDRIKSRRYRVKEIQGCGCVISILALIALPIVFFVDKKILPVVGIVIVAGIVIFIAASIFKRMAYDR